MFKFEDALFEFLVDLDLFLEAHHELDDETRVIESGWVTADLLPLLRPGISLEKITLVITLAREHIFDLLHDEALFDGTTVNDVRADGDLCDLVKVIRVDPEDPEGRPESPTRIPPDGFDTIVDLLELDALCKGGLEANG